MTKINWGIIGLGGIAQSFAQGFKDTQNSKLLAIASNNTQRLQNFREKFDLEKKFSFSNYDDLINCKDVDIVYVALPNSLHYHWVKKIIENNKNVLVEKPATINLSEALDIKKILKDKKIFFAEAFMYRHHPQISLILDMIKNDEIGDLKSMKSYFGMNLLTKKKFFFFNKKKRINKEGRLFNKQLGGGSILDLGCYPTSFSLLIGSLIKKIDNKNLEIKNIKKEIGTTNVDIDAYGEMHFGESFISKIYSSFKKNLGTQSIIKGEKGNIIIENTWSGSETVSIIHKDQKKIAHVNSRKNIYSYQINKISENILNGAYEPDYPGMTLNETLLNMKIIENWLNA